jgi:hypothetical protein
MKIANLDFKKRATGIGEILKLLAGLCLAVFLLHH